MAGRPQGCAVAGVPGREGLPQLAAGAAPPGDMRLGGTRVGARTPLRRHGLRGHKERDKDEDRGGPQGVTLRSHGVRASCDWDVPRRPLVPARELPLGVPSPRGRHRIAKRRGDGALRIRAVGWRLIRRCRSSRGGGPVRPPRDSCPPGVPRCPLVNNHEHRRHETCSRRLRERAEDLDVRTGSEYDVLRQGVGQGRARSRRSRSVG